MNTAIAAAAVFAGFRRIRAAFCPPPQGTSPAELAQAAVDYLGQRYPDWKWETQDEPYFLDSAGTVTGIATIGRRRHAIWFQLPLWPQYLAQADAFDTLYVWLDDTVRHQRKRDGLLAEEAAR